MEVLIGQSCQYIDDCGCSSLLGTDVQRIRVIEGQISEFGVLDR